MFMDSATQSDQDTMDPMAMRQKMTPKAVPRWMQIVANFGELERSRNPFSPSRI